MQTSAKVYIAVVCLVGAAGLAHAAAAWEAVDLARFAVYIVVSVFASGLKVKLPSITGTMSVNFFFILLGIAEMNLGETVALGCISILVQCLWQPKVRPSTVQILFNVGSNVIATSIAYSVYHLPIIHIMGGRTPLPLMLAAAVYFLLNTMFIAGVIALTERKPLRPLWYECYCWALPYYMVGASLAWVVSLWNQYFRWQSSLAIIPVIYFIYRSYRLYLDRLENEKKHVEEIAALHLRTIESLALAIEAKDFTTHDHLQRVRVYALEIGTELGLDQPEMNALRAAALLHDIGKLAVPEHIISKPGRLTPEEFEKMKIHPLVGAEILERVQFPYPVVPVVRAHHERWDGTGYPDGLKGEEIPVGARILGAVDALDALASDRQYRRALPLDEAMKIIVSESGKSFDPRVVKVLERRYRSLEPVAQAQANEKMKLSTGMRVHRDTAPAAGYEPVPEAGPYTLAALSSIAAARQEAQMLFELTKDLGNSLSLDETLSVAALRLRKMIPYETLAVYVKRDHELTPIYAGGDQQRLFASARMRIGEGLSGWVAENAKPLLNGDPKLELRAQPQAARACSLESALCVPLDGVNGLIGVLSLYKAEPNAFNKDHLRILLAISSKTSLAIENALKYRQAENSATTDYLTNLPNARSLFLRLDSELARCRRENATLAVVVGDLNGFKQLNDRHGHLEGNRVLRAVAEALQNSCRPYDYVARMGGDEFVAILTGIQPGAVPETLSRLDHIATAAAQNTCRTEWLSMSFGAALYPQDGQDAEQLLAEADRKMYKAKQARKQQPRVLQMPLHAQERLQPVVNSV